MKLSLTLHNKTYSVESEEQFDGTNLNELVEQFKGLLVCAGFHPTNADDMFNTDHQWFTEEERSDNMQGHLYGSSKIVNDWYQECQNEHIVEDTEAKERMQKRIEEWQNNMYKPDKENE